MSETGYVCVIACSLCGLCVSGCRCVHEPVWLGVATATNTRTTHYYTHITRFTHCSRINSSPHILPMLQANTTRGFIQSVLLMMGMMMPETC